MGACLNRVNLVATAFAFWLLFPAAAHARLSPDYSGDLWYLMLFPLIAPTIALVAVKMYAGRCSECKRRGGLILTGTVEHRGGGREWEESRCKYCGTPRWRELTDENPGGSGGGG